MANRCIQGINILKKCIILLVLLLVSLYSLIYYNLSLR